MGNGIFEPYRHELTYKSVPSTKVSFPDFFATMRQLGKQIQGKIVYAFKPRLPSFGVALLKKLSQRLPVILDIEDWDAEPFIHQPLGRKLYGAIRNLHSPLNGGYDWLFEKLVPLADERIVVSEFLRKRYGGVQLYHGADCLFFNPTKYRPKELKEKWGLAGKTVILFAGKALPHKGLEDLIGSVKLIGDPCLRVLLVGSSGSYEEFLQNMAGGFMVRIGTQPHSMMPELWSLADLIVFAQRNTPYAQAQVPAKVFEAMAMAKPIIAAAVSDLPEILSGCGWIVEPDNLSALAQAIEFALSHPDSAADMGWKAREKCKEKYSWDAMERTLIPIFRHYIG
jgi:glycosyltransferase involved in cell wall biosynthesis